MDIEYISVGLAHACPDNPVRGWGGGGGGEVWRVPASPLPPNRGTHSIEEGEFLHECEGPLNYRYTFTLLSHGIPARMYL